MILKEILLTMRLKQWSKNLLIFAGPIFAHKLFDLSVLYASIAGFFIFCLLSGIVYIVNDIVDRENDRNHPLKKNRPIARGTLKVSAASMVAIILLIVSLGSAFYLKKEFGYYSVFYLILQLFYSFLLKQMVILDVLTIAVGFVIRALAGTVLAGAEFSAWLLICTLLLALFLAICKRKNEILILNSAGVKHRKTLEFYSEPLLDQMIAVVTSSTVMAYALYTLDKRTRLLVSERLYFTIPFVLYGIFRYLYLVYKKNRGGEPSEILIADIPFLINLILWGICIFWFIYIR